MDSAVSALPTALLDVSMYLILGEKARLYKICWRPLPMEGLSWTLMISKPLALMRPSAMNYAVAAVKAQLERSSS